MRRIRRADNGDKHEGAGGGGGRPGLGLVLLLNLFIVIILPSKIAVRNHDLLYVLLRQSVSLVCQYILVD